MGRQSPPRDQREPSRLIDKEERDELDRALDRTDTIQHAKRRLKVKLELLHHEPYLRDKIAQRADEARAQMAQSHTRNIVRDNILRTREGSTLMLAEQERLRTLHVERAEKVKDFLQKRDQQASRIVLRSEYLTQVHALRRKRLMWRGLNAFREEFERVRLGRWLALIQLARGALSIEFVLRCAQTRWMHARAERVSWARLHGLASDARCFGGARPPGLAC